MNNQEYSAYCYSQLVQVFTNTHKGQPDDELKYVPKDCCKLGSYLAFLTGPMPQN
ncbi:hypothetical protein [Paraglaciecola sp. MB-3u-78]|uniref:hypothetical protein n=1 Tax=Paraglaciecola sp. MB-3u-78 TaxID=2058332 RepID=UPI0012FEFE9E|nr:hypothetical protein [Paraglaciecola sp. MB-3u-78]